ISRRSVSRVCRREHTARNRNRRLGQFVEPKRVICPVNAERGVHYRQEDLQLKTHRRSRLPVRIAQRRQILAELKLLSAYAGLEKWVQGRAAERCAVDGVELPIINAQL